MKTASHLGHDISEEYNMEQDMKCKRAELIDSSKGVREAFSFAQPNQILEALRTYCRSSYGAMKWALFTDKAQQVFNICAKCHGLPIATWWTTSCVLGRDALLLKQMPKKQTEFVL